MAQWSADDIALLREMAVGGEGEEAIALRLKRTRKDVREIAGLLGVSLEPLEKLEWCDKCCNPRSSLNPDTGWCEPCTTRWRLEKQREADEAEEERLRKEAERETNVVKKQRQRMREEFGANPRKGPRKEV